mmetsp:Transcript_33556/g.72659  ORF Transcript_33556/g.72659 Transcript_33556/m.72659 type:complete len:747 (+) Transcript_33556:653-2893(+)
MNKHISSKRNCSSNSSNHSKTHLNNSSSNSNSNSANNKRTAAKAGLATSAANPRRQAASTTAAALPGTTPAIPAATTAATAATPAGAACAAAAAAAAAPEAPAAEAAANPTPVEGTEPTAAPTPPVAEAADTAPPPASIPAAAAVSVEAAPTTSVPTPMEVAQESTTPEASTTAATTAAEAVKEDEAPKVAEAEKDAKPKDPDSADQQERRHSRSRRRRSRSGGGNGGRGGRSRDRSRDRSRGKNRSKSKSKTREGADAAAPPAADTKGPGIVVEEVKVTDAEGKLVTDVKTFGTFEEAGWAPPLLKAIQEAGFATPSQVQQYTWPIAIAGHNLVGIASTGSGKTVAFLFPTFQHIITNKVKRGDPTTLVLAPTRELACQIEKEANKFGQAANINVVCAYGGAPKYHQIEALKEGCHITIGTPGRLNDLLENKDLCLSYTHKLVIDEADRMLDMGFEPQIRKLLKELPEDRQTLFFTATWPSSVEKLALDFLKSPYKVEIGNPDVLKASANVTQMVRVVDPDRKVRELTKLFLQYDISERGRGENRAMIFCSTKRMCEQLEDGLNRAKVNCDSIHGDKDQQQREKALMDLRDGKTKIIVATDVAARGLDVQGVTLVVNYDPPNNAEDYVHRIGRTGRAGAKGFSVTFIARQDAGKARDLVQVMERTGQQVPKELRDLSARGGGYNDRRDRWRGGGGGGGGGKSSGKGGGQGGGGGKGGKGGKNFGKGAGGGKGSGQNRNRSRSPRR